MRSPRGERTYGPRPHVTGTVVRVTVTRHAGRARTPLELWLWWQGPGAPDLDVLWRAYLRRYDIAQLFRFLKQTLNWTTPQIRTPEQADRRGALWAVAGGGGLHPVAPGAGDGRGPAPTLAASPAAPASHPGARPARFCHAAPRARHPGRRAKTLRALARPAERTLVGACAALSRRQEGRLTAEEAEIQHHDDCG